MKLPREIDKIEERAFTLALRIYRRQSIKWIKELRQLKSYESFVNLSPMSKSFQKLLEKVLLLAHLVGVDSMQKEIGSQVKEFKETPSEIETGFDEAIRILRGRRIVSPAEYKAAAANIKASAFSVQRLERFDALLKVKRSLKMAINRGLTFSEWKESLPIVFEKMGITPLSPNHIETVFRTNISSIYNMARWNAAVGDPNVEGFEYYAIDDSRVTDICESLNGKRCPKDDPIWGSISPPNHYNCRSTLIPITMGYRKAEGIRWSRQPGANALAGVHPDFNHAPRSLKDYSKKIEKAVAKAEKKNDELNKEIEEGVYKPAETIQEAEAWARKNLTSEVNFKKLPQSMVSVANEVNRSLFELFKDYRYMMDGIKVINRQSEKYRHTPFFHRARYEGGKLVKTELNINYGYFKFKGLKSMEQIKSDFMEAYREDWWVAKNLQDMVNHEYGHFLTTRQDHFQMGVDRLALAWHRVKISKYGSTHGSEALAEIFSLYRREGKKALKKEWIDFFNKFSEKVKI